MTPFRSTLPLVWFLVLGCEGPPPSGTSVGNPSLTTTTLRTAGSSGVSLVSGQLATAGFEATDVDGLLVTSDAPETVDPRSGAQLSVPEGQWQQLVIAVQPPLTYTVGSGDRTVEVSLDIAEIVLHAARDAIDLTQDTVLELAEPGWLDRVEVGGETEIGPGHPLHDELAAAVAYRSAVFGDDDRDREVDTDERDRPMGEGESRGRDDTGR